MDFDFLNSTAEADKAKPLIPDILDTEHGPNLTQLNKMTRKQFTQGVLNVYQALGGDVWLLQQAAIDPKSFIEMLKKLIPTNMNLDQMEGFSITLVDRYGNRAELSPNEDSPRAVELGPNHRKTAHNEEPGPVPDINVTETYAPATLIKPRLLSDNSPKQFDFEL